MQTAAAKPTAGTSAEPAPASTSTSPTKPQPQAPSSPAQRQPAPSPVAEPSASTAEPSTKSEPSRGPPHTAGRAATAGTAGAPPAADAEEAASPLPAAARSRAALSMDAARAEMQAKSLQSPSAFLKALRATVDKAAAQPAARGQAQPAAESKARPVVTRASQASSPGAGTSHRVVLVASEAAPYSKTGGLGDVVASLPQALAAQGHRVMVVTPRYLTGREDRKVMGRLRDCQAWTQINLQGGRWVNFHHERRAGVDWVLVQHESFERHGGLYGDNEGTPYQDNTFRCGSICKIYMRFSGTIAHSHGWQSRQI